MYGSEGGLIRNRNFVKNPNEPVLDNHELRDKWEGHKSIDITNDYRAIYYEWEVDDEVVAYFVAIGTHDQLYRPKN